jgi:hypothetical protein
MDFDTVVGVILVVASLVAIGALVCWSRRTINRIADKKLESARDIIRDLRNVG